MLPGGLRWSHCDRANWNLTQGDRARTAIEAFSGGRLLIGIFGAPYPCPPAPFKLAMLLVEQFHARGIDGAIEVFSPRPLSLPILGQAGCGSFESHLEEAGIAFLRDHSATAVEDGAVAFGDAKRPFDLLLGVPHRFRRWSRNPA